MRHRTGVPERRLRAIRVRRQRLRTLPGCYLQRARHLCRQRHLGELSLRLTCSGHGTCVASGTSASCRCVSGYHAEALTCVADAVDRCSGITCSGHGTCVASGTSASCRCVSGYHAEALTCVADAVDRCSGIICSGHGTCVASGTTASCACDPGHHPVGLTCVPDGGVDEFTFIVFGDLNGGGCDRNDRVHQNVVRMAAEPDIAFYVQTGDIIDGSLNGSGTSCFASDPQSVLGVSACGSGIPNGNMASILAPLKERAPFPGLPVSYFQALGNHDDNWGSGRYPDPCGQGICDFLAPDLPSDFINHPIGDVCSLSQSSSTMRRDFYYSFAYGNSYFIVLRLEDDYYNMISSCNSNPGHASCGPYCSDPALRNDAQRLDSCWGDVQQWDWLVDQLDHAKGAYEHIFVFAHAPLLTSSDNHRATAEASVFRDLLERYNVTIYFNGHNHAYERSHRVRGASPDVTGTSYVTVGPAGTATLDGVNGAWFTAATASSGGLGALNRAAFLKVHVSGGTVSGSLYSLGKGATPVDQFTY